MKKIGIASCDWKSPNELVEDLMRILPQLGVFCKQLDDGGDSVTLILSNEVITDEEYDDIFDCLNHSEHVNIE